MPTLLIHSHTLTEKQIQQIESTLVGKLNVHPSHYRIETHAKPAVYQALSHALQIDINQMPESFAPSEIKLIISDMDSTLISIECVDEIADFVNLKPQVAAITEQAMRGELDFDQSLTKRVALLKGLATDALDSVYQERLTLNPGAETLIHSAKKQEIAFALVSGGFTFFTEKLQERLQLDFTRANTLEVIQDKLTGNVVGEIINAKAKAKFLQELCHNLDIKPSQVIAMGDGANDLAMMDLAGLTVAYCAKPAVQARADIHINYSELDSLLDFLL